MFLMIEKGESLVSPVLLQWHSRLARRTYMSVSTKKCEGREFEPPLEQALLKIVQDFSQKLHIFFKALGGWYCSQEYGQIPLSVK